MASYEDLFGDESGESDVDFDESDLEDSVLGEDDNVKDLIVTEDDLPENCDENSACPLPRIPTLVFVDETDTVCVFGDDGPVNTNEPKTDFTISATDDLDDEAFLALVINEPEVTQSQQPQNTSATTTTTAGISKPLSCPFCFKGYKNKQWYKSHVEKCVKKHQVENATGADNGGNNSNENVTVNVEKEKEFLTNGNDLLDKALQSVVDDRIYQICEPGTSTGALAKLIKESISPAKETYQKHLLQSIFKIVSDPTNFLKNTAAALGKFHNFCVGETEINKWENFLTDIGVSVIDKVPSRILFNCVVNYILKETVSFHKPKQDAPKIDFNLTKDEEESLYYVAGYLVYSIRKNTKTKTEQGKTIHRLLNTWGSKKDEDFQDLSLNDYTRAWVDQVNRGGLFKVNGQFYNLVVIIEKVARSILNLSFFATYCGESIRVVLREAFEQSEDVIKAWKLLTSNVANVKIKDKLLQLLLNKWINVRANAFIKVWLQQYKWKQSKKGEEVTEQGEPSLRKSLAKSKKRGKKLMTPTKPSSPRKAKSRTVRAAAKKLATAKAVKRKIAAK